MLLFVLLRIGTTVSGGTHSGYRLYATTNHQSAVDCDQHQLTGYTRIQSGTVSGTSFYCVYMNQRSCWRSGSDMRQSRTNTAPIRWRVVENAHSITKTRIRIGSLHASALELPNEPIAHENLREIYLKFDIQLKTSRNRSTTVIAAIHIRIRLIIQIHMCFDLVWSSGFFSFKFSFKNKQTSWTIFFMNIPHLHLFTLLYWIS